MLRPMVEVDEESCKSCRFCIDVSRCMSPSQCIGCLSCYWSCPYNARKIKFLELEEKNVSIWVEDRVYLVPYPSTLKEALENIGIAFGKNGSRNLSSPCNLGGCWACSVIVDEKLERTCITPVITPEITQTSLFDVSIHLRIVYPGLLILTLKNARIGIDFLRDN
ncbi:MAG: 4Fe-4S binding protein [Nitrososphaerota archaeon]